MKSSSTGGASTLTGLNSLGEETYDPFMFLDAKLAKEYLSNRVKESFLDEVKSSEMGAQVDSAVIDGDRQRLFIKTDCVNEANGSSFIEIGNSKVLCSLYGPREVPRKDDYDFKIANLNVEFRFASFSCFMQRRGTLSQRDQTLDERNYSSIIEKSLKSSILLHKYPKSQIDIYILCIQNDIDSKNILTASTIAASMALTNASIEVYDLVASYTSRRTNLTVSYMPALHQITNVHFDMEQQQQQQEDTLAKASVSCDFFRSQVKECVENCKKVHSFMKLCILKSASDELKSKETE